MQFDVGQYRLYNQGISEAAFEQPRQVVERLLAIQAQDYPGALWAVGLRMKAATPAVVEQAIIDRQIVRTWPMRGTLHFLAADDVRWMVKLLASRAIANHTARYRELELDEKDFSRSKHLFEKALAGGKQLTRAELCEVLEKGGIAPTGQRAPHILARLAQDGFLCFGSHLGKQPTFALLDEWLPPTKELAQEEALAELALRYFTSHGPATLQDLQRWGGLKLSDVKTGLELVKDKLRREDSGGQTYWLPENDPLDPTKYPAVHLLPGFDEYILGYKDRSAVLDPQYNDRIVPGGNGIFFHTIVSGGRVVGTWKRTVKKSKISLALSPFTELTGAEMAGVEAAAARYGQFMGLPVEIEKQ